MAKLSPNAPCPCGAGPKYKKCCRRWHQGAAAPTAEALMRARYSAYVAHRADYILDTTHPESPHAEADRDAWRAEVERFCRAVIFDGLTVRAAREEGDRAIVEFEARMHQGEREASMVERSRFFRVGGRWLYHSGERVA